MMGLEAVNSSKSGTIRSLLIRAWRERWTDLQWGIHIKTVLPRCVSGDIYHLADYILQQALMGHLPNNLILSYLKHSLCAQVVSHGGVIESISKYDGFHKPHCVAALLQLLQSMMKSISCRGKPEDCLQLATALVGGVKWLGQVLAWTCQQLLDLGVAPEHSNNMALAGQLLLHILKDPFLMCMMDIGRREEPSLWSECSKKMTEVEALLAGATAVVDNKDILIDTVCGLRESAPLKGLSVRHVYDCTSVPLCYAMHSLVMLEVLMHTTRDAQAFGQQLLMLKQLKGLSVEQLYLELLRCAFLGLSSPDHHHYQELKWVGFTFIKVPAILQHIHNTTSGDTGPSEELVSAIKKISSLTMLLDYSDTRINCNCLEYLLNELCTSLTLITERDAQAIIAER